MSSTIPENTPRVKIKRATKIPMRMNSLTTMNVRYLLHCVSVAIFVLAIQNIKNEFIKSHIVAAVQNERRGNPGQSSVSYITKTTTNAIITEIIKLIIPPIVNALGAGFSHKGAEPPRYGDPSMGYVGRSIPQSQSLRLHFSINNSILDSAIKIWINENRFLGY